MRRPLRITLSTALCLAVVWLVWLSVTNGLATDSGQAEVGAVVDPYASPLLADYKSFRDASMAADLESIAAVAESADGFLKLRAALTLARAPELSPPVRLQYYRLAEPLRIEEPLARSENRAFYLEYAATAEAAGAIDEALALYARALPEEKAVSALARLDDNPYTLANRYFRAGLHRQALEALGDLQAPSIEAPSHQSLGNHDLALDAFERWLAEQPDNLDARYGRAWSHFYLGDLARARELFEALPGESALYGRALIARREGDLDGAVALLRQSGEPSRLWLASGWLEAENRLADAVPVYLQLAETSSVYADDAAYRALVLAERLGDQESAGRARALLPAGSFFALKLGEPVPTPDRDELPVVEPPQVALAWELARVNDLEAAQGELIFALREAQDEALIVALAEALQLLGEFRQSQRAAQRLVDGGSREMRTWRAAYPRAFPDIVAAQSQAHGVAPELVWAVMRQESAFYPAAVSTSNAKGLMQVIPSTWDWLAELQNEEPGDPFEPEDNIRYGTYYLSWLLDYHSDDPELVIPSYNRGQGYIRRLFESDYVAGDKDDFFREIDALETREYLQRVSVNLEIYRALYGQQELAGTPSTDQALP